MKPEHLYKLWSDYEIYNQNQSNDLKNDKSPKHTHTQMVTSIIDQQVPHNWVTKGAKYLALPRAAKHEVIWQQITADS